MYMCIWGNERFVFKCTGAHVIVNRLYIDIRHYQTLNPPPNISIIKYKGHLMEKNREFDKKPIPV